MFYNWSENARKDEVKFQLSPASFRCARNISRTGTGRFLYAEIPVAAFQQ